MLGGKHMENKQFQNLSEEELQVISGGFDGGAAVSTVGGAAAVVTGVASGQPWAVVAGCLIVGYNIARIFR